MLSGNSLSHHPTKRTALVATAELGCSVIQTMQLVIQGPNTVRELITKPQVSCWESVCFTPRSWPVLAPRCFCRSIAQMLGFAFVTWFRLLPHSGVTCTHLYILNHCSLKAHTYDNSSQCDLPLQLSDKHSF